jgi:hypothetical protein
VQHAEPDADAERQQAFFAAPASSPSASCTRSGNSPMRSCLGATGAAATVPITVGPPVLVGHGWRLSRSQRDRTRREDRRLKFYGLRDNLESPVQPILEALGKDVPGDEAIMFRIEPDTQITFRRSQLREADWLDRGRRVLYVDQGGLIITVCADEDARAIQASLAARNR